MEISDYLECLKPSKRKRQKRRDKRLHEELIECRRDLGGKTNKKSRRKGVIRIRQRQALTGFPYRESIKTLGNNRSYPSDNLQPLIHWLQTNTGCPWDQVYSKLVRQLDTRSTLGQHIIDHLWDFVDIYTRIVDGKLIYTNCYGAPKEQHKWFFVHPETGILYSNRYEMQKGPYPRKARWKLEKKKRMQEASKLRHKQRKASKEVKVYPYAPIKTKNSEIQVGKEYTLQTSSFEARVKLLADMSHDRYGPFVFFKILILDCSLHWLKGLKTRVYYREGGNPPNWTLL